MSCKNPPRLVPRHPSRNGKGKSRAGPDSSPSRFGRVAALRRGGFCNPRRGLLRPYFLTRLGVPARYVNCKSWSEAKLRVRSNDIFWSILQYDNTSTRTCREPIRGRIGRLGHVGYTVPTAKLEAFAVGGHAISPGRKAGQRL